MSNSMSDENNKRDIGEKIVSVPGEDLHNLEVRVASVESDIRHINDSVASLDSKINNVLSAVNGLAQKQASSGKLDARILLGIGGFVLSSIGVAVTIITVVGAMALAPVKESAREERNTRQAMDETMLERIKLEAAHFEKLNAISTADMTTRLFNLEDWTKEHDQRVVSTNSAQSIKIDENNEDIEQMRERLDWVMTSLIENGVFLKQHPSIER